MIDHLDIDKNQPIISVVELNRANNNRKSKCLLLLLLLLLFIIIIIIIIIILSFYLFAHFMNREPEKDVFFVPKFA